MIARFSLPARALRALAVGALLASPSACVAVAAVGVAGDVVEGTAKTAVFGVKTTGKVIGAAIPDGEDEEERRYEEAVARQEALAAERREAYEARRREAGRAYDGE